MSCARFRTRTRRAVALVRSSLESAPSDFMMAATFVSSAEKYASSPYPRSAACSVPASTNVSIRSTLPATSPVERRYSVIAALASRSRIGRWLKGSGNTAPSTKCRYFSIAAPDGMNRARSEEHTSELQSRGHLVCRLLLEKKKEKKRRENH